MLSAAANEPNSPITQAEVNLTVTIVLVVGAIYFGLWFWAKSAPFPAALTGLILFGSLWFGEILIDPSMIWRGILIKVIIVAVLVKAVQAGLEYRKLQAKAGGRAG